MIREHAEARNQAATAAPKPAAKPQP
jgi:hypothetical protein